MATAQYKIISTLTRANLDSTLKRVFKDNPGDMDTYGISGDYCYRWVKNALIDIGIVETPYRTIPGAWDFFAGLPSTKMKYFDTGFSNVGKREKYPYHEAIDEPIAFVFGFFPTSKYKTTSINSIKKNAPDKIPKLTEVKRKGVNEEFQPITHIGLYVNGVFYDFAQNSVRMDHVSSFVPIAYYEFEKDLYSKLP